MLTGQQTEAPKPDPLRNERAALARMLARMRDQLSDDCPLTLVLVGTRGEKAINDLFGKGASETALAQIGHRLDAGLSGRALCRRVAPDLFAVIMTDLNDQDQVHAFCKTLSELVAAPCDIGQKGVHLASVIGAAMCRTAQAGKAGSCDPERMIDQAAKALAVADAKGSSEPCIFDPALEIADRRRHTVEKRLRTAIADETIDVHFQPIICLRRGCIGGFEALARWNDAELGFVPPDEFIAIAEAKGFIDELFRIVLNKALRAARQWPPGLFVAVNLSPSQMADSHTTRVIFEALHRHRLSPSRLEIEITETAVISHHGVADGIIAMLKDAGVRISLDDFGTGQSSLNRLRRLPFDKLKIDRSFVTEIEHDVHAEAIVRAIIQMCQALEIRVIVEGIETVEQAAKMVMMGCDGAQGYLFKRPCSADETLAFIAENMDLADTLKQPAASVA